jgi:RIO-like serine/threonine protein kinase
VRLRPALEAILPQLGALHAADLIHGDVRAWNVMQFEWGYSIVDFDLSCRVGSGAHSHNHTPSTQNSTLSYTLHYYVRSACISRVQQPAVRW